MTEPLTHENVLLLIFSIDRITYYYTIVQKVRQTRSPDDQLHTT